jgi:hypothetical protein
MVGFAIGERDDLADALIEEDGFDIRRGAG